MLMQISNRQYQYFEIDDADFDMICKYTWYISYSGYIIAYINRSPFLLHRLLFGLVTNDNKIIDHIDGDRTNNHRDNLRLCTSAQNSRNSRKKSSNSSGFKGVVKDGNKWKAVIQSEGRYISLGQYNNKIEAAKAYDKAASELYKEFANLNFNEGSENHFSNDTTSSFNFYKVVFSSEYYGVSFTKRDKRWRASMFSSGNSRYFKTEKEAALAVDEYILKNNLDKSKLNFPEEIEK